MDGKTKEKLLDELAAAALASNNPLAAVEDVREALRGRVLGAVLDAAGWNLNETARRVRMSVSGVRKVLREHHPELAAEAARKGPPQIGTKKT